MTVCRTQWRQSVGPSDDCRTQWCDNECICCDNTAATQLVAKEGFVNLIQSNHKLALCDKMLQGLYSSDHCFLFSSVQSKMVSMHSGRPICAAPHLSGVSPMLPLKQFECWSDWRWPFLILSRKIVERFLFLRLSPQAIDVDVKKSKTEMTGSVEENKSKHATG